MRWIDCIIPLRPKGGLGFEDFDAMEDSFFIQVKDELFGDDWLHCYVTQILNAKYEYIDIRDVFDELMHLNAKQKADLLHILIIIIIELKFLSTSNGTPRSSPCSQAYLDRTQTRTNSADAALCSATSLRPYANNVFRLTGEPDDTKQQWSITPSLSLLDCNQP
jgi:hypothetical protein